VPNARLTDEEKEDCLVMDKENGNYGPCEYCSEDLIEAAREYYSEQLQEYSTGYEVVESSDYLSLGFPSTAKDYEMVGSEEEQAIVNGLKSFQPEMVGRERLPIRNQGGCGSCYSSAASHTISSSYAQENGNSELLVFSNQHFMNCLPLKLTAFVAEDEDSVVIAKDMYEDSGIGCWGGSARTVIDMVVYYGSKVPLLEVEPYIGFQGHCDMTKEMVDTGKVTCICF